MGIIMLNHNMVLNQKEISSTVLTVKVFDPEIIEGLLKEDIISYGFMWSISGNNFKNGILVNVHIQDGKIIDDWHSELINTNYGADDYFCVNVEKTIDSVTTVDESINTTIESEGKFSYLSENYLELKLVEDAECYSNVKAIIMS